MKWVTSGGGCCDKESERRGGAGRQGKRKERQWKGGDSKTEMENEIIEHEAAPFKKSKSRAGKEGLWLPASLWSQEAGHAKLFEGFSPVSAGGELVGRRTWPARVLT